jgi:hypothetical protein
LIAWTFTDNCDTVAASSIPAHALYFAGYEMAKAALLPKKSATNATTSQSTLSSKPSFINSGLYTNCVYFLAGLWADVLGSFIWVPMVMCPL